MIRGGVGTSSALRGPIAQLVPRAQTCNAHADFTACCAAADKTKGSVMHPITVRQMKFDVPSADEFHPLCIAGSSALSYTHLATGLYVTHLEPFFVKSLRRVMDQIRDEALREDADRF